MWYLKAAELGHAEAQNRLAVIYGDIENDYKEAIKWYKIAMDQDNPWAYRNYAFCLWNGNGVKKNKKKAIEMMQKAISLGHPDAENELNEMQQSLEEAPNAKKHPTSPKKSSQIKKKPQEKENRSDVNIENVSFSTDGRKTLFLEYECMYNHDLSADCEYVYLVYVNNKRIAGNEGYSDCGFQVAKNREKFRLQIADYQLNLKTNTNNNITVVVEARKLDEYWDGSKDQNTYPLVFSSKTNFDLYYEFHIFGKNVLEIK